MQKAAIAASFGHDLLSFPKSFVSYMNAKAAETKKIAMLI